MQVRIWSSTRLVSSAFLFPVLLALLSMALPCAAATVTSVTCDPGSIIGGSTQQATVTIDIQRGPLDTGSVQLSLVPGTQVGNIYLNTEPVPTA